MSGEFDGQVTVPKKVSWSKWQRVEEKRKMNEG
jgi:hypothetical protein